ncbi:MarR family winged helix-turn-helix transcriptional regulator [Clostridium estertheticum]|uniref:MarR family winged helix-turn-helix transcriptional regulator n=1 Tax=Clostridium estertheticum TaxID=238834 RepID=UPI001C0CB46D|nr:MarR family winged helix-turn-helix transcriptional regulator [Clostridium estertheticum]MBU3213822.1 MarR family winged helix-turn-helix transcriptional regulator [Clostridium estertheticum]WAG53705.1 MarR family winged helix-turn-helix transcriptional regulator [Clostridium estertheticum]
MRDYTLVANTMEQIIYKYIGTEKISKDYNTGVLLTQVEIHTIEGIGNNEGINITGLSAIRQKTKGAVSQMVYKLVDKGLVEKSISKISDSEVSLTLTELGKKAYKGHKKFHDMANDKVFKKLREMDENSYNDLVEILKDFESFLDEQISNK